MTEIMLLIFIAWVIIIHVMNNYTPLLERRMAPILGKMLSQFPVVVLTGARQTGKTTLVSMKPLSESRLFRSLDDFDVLDRARKSPQLLVEETGDLTIDEVQRAPDLLLAIKRSVDRSRRAGRFLLTGSANLLVMRQVSESLAGRAIYLRLCPLTWSEKHGHPGVSIWDKLVEAKTADDALEALPRTTSSADWTKHAAEGGFPVAATLDPQGRSVWFDGYIRTYLERDLQDLASISSLVDFRRLMKVAAHRIGQMTNQTEIARDAGVPQATAHRWLNLLETSFQIIRIPAYAANRTKRLIKTPKLYFGDLGLGAHLADLGTAEDIAASPAAGAFFENVLLAELVAWKESTAQAFEICYWRTHTGHEVDFVIERGRSLLPLEMKVASRATSSDARNLEEFLREYPKLASWGGLIYGGREVFKISERILAIPLGALLGAIS
jgi:predicted AAA+ superfamily ATPase